MLKKNDEYIVEIIDNGFQGEGITKIDGITVFINEAIKGEKIKIKILKVLKNFAYGKIIEIFESSKARKAPDCNTYSRCGGCNLRHIEYNETLKIKKSIVENCLYKELKKEIKVEDVIGMENPIYYRNKLQYPVGVDKDNKITMGVYSARTHSIIPTQKCFIQNEVCQEIANDILEFARAYNISAYNEETLKNRKLIKANMLTNPFEKFERKRFLYISKDLGVISMNHALFSRMEQEDFQRVKEQMMEDLRNYYKDMGI